MVATLYPSRLWPTRCAAKVVGSPIRPTATGVIFLPLKVLFGFIERQISGCPAVEVSPILLHAVQTSTLVSSIDMSDACRANTSPDFWSCRVRPRLTGIRAANGNVLRVIGPSITRNCDFRWGWSSDSSRSQTRNVNVEATGGLENEKQYRSFSVPRTAANKIALGRREDRGNPDPSRLSHCKRPIAIWLILPVVICLSQRLSHACLCTNFDTVKPRMAH